MMKRRMKIASMSQKQGDFSWCISLYLGPHTAWGLKMALRCGAPSFEGAQSAAHLADGLEGSALEGTFLVPPQDLIRLLNAVEEISRLTVQLGGGSPGSWGQPSNLTEPWPRRAMSN